MTTISDTTTLATLHKGQRAIIRAFKDPEMSLKLLEMGCLPGTEVEMCQAAPLGDPLCIHVAGYSLSLRIDEASTIEVDIIK